MISNVTSGYTYNPLYDTSTTSGTGTTGTSATGTNTTGSTSTTGVVGPAQPSSGSPSSLSPLSNSLNKDDFMKMLVAQMQNQDPDSPMDGKDMAAQLAQFSAVEQLENLNTTISAQTATETQMAASIAALSTAQQQQGDTLATLIQGQMAVSTVGKVGVTDGNQLFVDRDGTGSITVDTGTLAGTGTLVVKDSSGNVVAQGAVQDVKAGLQNIDLRDVAFSGDAPKGGAYTYSFQTTSGTNAPVDAQTYSTGRITGLSYDNGSPVLMIGDSLSVPFSQLVQVRS